MPVWATIVIAALAIIPGTLLGYAALVTAKNNQSKLTEVAHSVNGLLAARVKAARAEGKVSEQEAQILRENGK